MREEYGPRWWLDLLYGSLLVLLLWQLLASLVRTPALPPPLVALQAFGRLIGGEMGLHLLVSLYRVAASLCLGLVLGVPLGLYVGRQERADRPGVRPSVLARLLRPVIFLLYPIPKVVLLPVVVVLLGVGDSSKIFLITLIIFFQIMVTARDAAREVSPLSVLSLRSLGASEWELYRHVIFPASLPKLFTALRISLGTAVAVLFFSETFATTRGIGYFVVDMLSRLAYGAMFAGVMGMALLGLGLYLALDWLEARLCPWVQR